MNDPNKKWFHEEYAQIEMSIRNAQLFISEVSYERNLKQFREVAEKEFIALSFFIQGATDFQELVIA